MQVTQNPVVALFPADGAVLVANSLHEITSGWMVSVRCRTDVAQAVALRIYNFDRANIRHHAAERIPAQLVYGARKMRLR
ncbi:MAG TPA: hypothetical protein VNH82_11805 [Candidatus Dormibacteraeota bacterium]|nr:hypothetical protein [Candidatus Dormibacteraeota bacterium]